MPPDGIRPGQLGVVLLGHVVIGDVAATLVDLSIRRLLRVDRPSGEDAGWLLSPLHTRAPRYRLQTLLPYEETLLEGLSHDGPQASLPSLHARIATVLDHTRAALVHDAVHRGWLRRLHHDQRTEAGERMVARIRRFQAGLRRLAAEPDEDALTGSLLPYALRLGLMPGSEYPLARFARAWVDAFASLPGWNHPTPKPYNALDAPVPMENKASPYTGF